MRFKGVLFVLSGCAVGVGKDPDTGDLRLPPDIVVATSQLRFPVTSPGTEERKSITVRNDGGSDLEVTEVVVDGEAFALDGDGVATIAPLEQILLDVVFAPSGGMDHVGTASIVSDDPDESEVVVELIGQAETSELVFEGPLGLFDDVRVPCEKTGVVTLRSVGSLALMVSEISLAGEEAWQLAGMPDLPTVLAPGASLEVRMTYGPAAVEVTTATLTVVTDAPDSPLSQVIDAPGGYIETVVDAFVAPIDAPVDILFALDRTCSMVGELERLSTGFEAFIEVVEDVTDGWQIGVVSQEDGCFNQGVLSVDTPDYETAFREAVTGGGTNPLSERLLAMTGLALLQTPDGSCNEGFLRPGALLHVIAVSDEAEQSGREPDLWLADYSGFVTDPALLKVSAIADITVDCGLGSGAVGYEEAVELTGGVLLDICDDLWIESVDELALATVTALREYPLSREPVSTSIAVTVDGVVNTDWSWDPKTNMIRFGTPPVAGETIEVAYGLPATCD